MQGKAFLKKKEYRGLLKIGLKENPNGVYILLINTFYIKRKALRAIFISPSYIIAVLYCYCHCHHVPLCPTFVPLCDNVLILNK